MSETIGFIGLGIMGQPMAHNLLKAGFSLVVDGHHQEVTAMFTAKGAQFATSSREIATSCDIVITMLPDTHVVEEVVIGSDGIIEGTHEGLVVIDMSTISPIVTRNLSTQLAEQGVKMLDAPVSGGDKGAIEGTLSITVGGDEATFTRCLPLFQALGKTIVHVGESGAGQVVKACNQIVVALVIEAVGEALVLGTKAGVDPAKIVQVLGGGLAANKG